LFVEGGTAGALVAGGVEVSVDGLQPTRTNPLNTHNSNTRDVFLFIVPDVNTIHCEFQLGRKWIIISCNRRPNSTLRRKFARQADEVQIFCQTAETKFWQAALLLAQQIAGPA
jgi:hypothetical protein